MMAVAITVFFSETVEDWYQAAFFEALDLVIEGIKDFFDQPGYAIYRNLEELLVKEASSEEYSGQKKQVCELYNDIAQCATGKSSYLLPE